MVCVQNSSVMVAKGKKHWDSPSAGSRKVLWERCINKLPHVYLEIAVDLSQIGVVSSYGSNMTCINFSLDMKGSSVERSWSPGRITPPVLGLQDLGTNATHSQWGMGKASWQSPALGSDRLR